MRKNVSSRKRDRTTCGIVVKLAYNILSGLKEGVIIKVKERLTLDV